MSTSIPIYQPRSFVRKNGLTLTLCLLALCATPAFAATAAPTATQFFGDDINTSTIAPFPASYQTYCPWILDGLTAQGYTAANGYNFAFAGTGVAAGIANIPLSDFNISVYEAWVVTNDPVPTPDGINHPQRPVTNAEAGGANFVLTYVPRANSTDPVKTNFIQAYVDNINGGGFGTGIIDNAGHDQASGGNPYYNSYGRSGVLANGNPWMRDIPYTCEDEPADASCNGGVDDSRISESVQFQTFIAGVDPVKIGAVDYTILYGGVQWGYTYTSADVPEPGYGFFAGAILIGFAAVRKYRVSRPQSR